MAIFKEEDLLKFLDKMGNDGYSPWNTVNAQKAAVIKVLSVLNEEERQNLSSDLNIPTLIARFETKAKNELNSDSLRTYAGRFKRAYKGFIEWNQDPSNYKPKTRKIKNSKKLSPKPTSTSSPNPSIEIKTTNHQLNANMLVKYPILTETIRGSIEIPEKLSESDVKRIIPLITQIISSHSFKTNQQLNEQDSKEYENESF